MNFPFKSAVFLCAFQIFAGAVLISALALPTPALAQLDDSYDPFVDYSEFDEISEEEADINFFRNGRFFTLGFIGGRRAFTQGMRNVYNDGITFGVYMSYFFDLRFALQFSYMSGAHGIGFTTPSGTSVTGDASVSAFGFDLKYYFNTQNVTRGLAALNPYAIGGFSYVTRETTISGQEAFGKDGTMGFDVGGGIEIPMLRNKMYFGAQATYHIVNFKDESQEIIVNSDEATGIFPTGDMISILGILGVNF